MSPKGTSESRRNGIPGRTRATIYRLAALTGLRAGEIKSLHVSSFDLDGDAPQVIVEAKASKRRREDQPLLRPDLAAELRTFLAGRAAGQSAFGLPKSWRSAGMLRFDLERAGIPVRDERGHVADFHSIRVSFVSWIAKGGVAMKIAQTLARHSTPLLTFNTYAKHQRSDERQALDALPRPNDHGSGVARAAQAQQKAQQALDGLSPCARKLPGVRDLEAWPSG